jgi:hypothetical protein
MSKVVFDKRVSVAEFNDSLDPFTQVFRMFLHNNERVRVIQVCVADTSCREPIFFAPSQSSRRQVEEHHAHRQKINSYRLKVWRYALFQFLSLLMESDWVLIPG